MILNITTNILETVLHYRLDQAASRTIRDWANQNGCTYKAAAIQALNQGLAALALDLADQARATAAHSPTTDSL